MQQPDPIEISERARALIRAAATEVLGPEDEDDE